MAESENENEVNKTFYKKIRSINTHKQRELQWVFKFPMGFWYK